MIKINDDFSFEWDVYSWKLIEIVDGMDKDKNPKKQERHTWHPSIPMLCQYVLGRGLADSVSLEDIKEKIDEAMFDIKSMFRNLNEEPIRDREAAVRQ